MDGGQAALVVGLDSSSVFAAYTCGYFLIKIIAICVAARQDKSDDNKSVPTPGGRVPLLRSLPSSIISSR